MRRAVVITVLHPESLQKIMLIQDFCRFGHGLLQTTDQAPPCRRLIPAEKNKTSTVGVTHFDIDLQTAWLR